jgi:hypothetical protein
MPNINLFFLSRIPLSIQIDKKMVAHFGGQTPATTFFNKLLTHARTTILFPSLKVPYTLSVSQISFPDIEFSVDPAGM